MKIEICPALARSVLHIRASRTAAVCNKIAKLQAQARPSLKLLKGCSKGHARAKKGQKALFLALLFALKSRTRTKVQVNLDLFFQRHFQLFFLGLPRL